MAIVVAVRVDTFFLPLSLSFFLSFFFFVLSFMLAFWWSLPDDDDDYYHLLVITKRNHLSPPPSLPSPSLSLSTFILTVVAGIVVGMGNFPFIEFHHHHLLLLHSSRSFSLTFTLGLVSNRFSFLSFSLSLLLLSSFYAIVGLHGQTLQISIYIFI